MSNQPPLIQYPKKGPPYVKIGGSHHDDLSSDPPVSDAFSVDTERCCVKGCTNTFATQPPKIFVPFPTQSSKRMRWLKVIGLDPALPPSEKLFCCEDHFDLKRDVMQLSTLRSVNSGIVPNLLKDCVVPHRRTNSDAPAVPQPDSSAGAVVSKKQPDSCSVPKIRVKSAHELMISSTTSLSDVPLVYNACTRPPESVSPQRLSVIHEPPTSPSPSVMQTSVIRPTPHLPTATSATSQVSADGARIVDGKHKYRECAVRGCPSNLRTSSETYLVCVPIQDSVREAWYKAIGRPYSKKSMREDTYVCTKHFREEELEPVKRTYGKSESHGPDQLYKRVSYGVLPTLNLTQPFNDGAVWTNRPPRVPDLTPHSPSSLVAEPNDAQVSSVPHAPRSRTPQRDLSQKLVSPKRNSLQEILEEPPPAPMPNVPVKSKPSIPVQPRYQKYVPTSMPQYPECKHKVEEYYCTSLSVVDCSSFYSQFYSLDSRDEQNQFIFTHTEMVSSPSSESEQPVFKFFIDQKSPEGATKRLQVCAQAFSTCLSFEITALISLVTRHFDTLLSESHGQQTVILHPVKLENEEDKEGEEGGVTNQDPVPDTLKIEDFSKDGMLIKIKKEESEEVVGSSVESDVNRPLTVEEELLQTVRNVLERCGTSGFQDYSETLDKSDLHGTEDDPGTFETVHICRRCLAQFKSQTAYDAHERESGSCNQFLGEFFNCATCGRTLTSFEDLKVHTSVYHKQDNGQKNRSQKTLLNIVSLWSPRSHVDDWEQNQLETPLSLGIWNPAKRVCLRVSEEYVCPKCSDTFRYRRYLEDHVVKCTGTNRLTEEMVRLISRIKVMKHKIAVTRQREAVALKTGKSVTSEMPEASVVIEKLNIPDDEKRTYNINELLDILKGQPVVIPRHKIKAASNNAVNSTVSKDKKKTSSSVDKGGFRGFSSSVKADPEEEVDVESVASPTGPEEMKEETLTPRKQPKRRLSSSSEEEVIRKHTRRGRRVTSPTETNPIIPMRQLRTRRPRNLAEPELESDTEQIPELAGSGGESDVDPDFDPSKTETRRGRKRRSRRKVSSDSEDTSDSEMSPRSSTSRKTTSVNVKCGQCNASYANINGLRAHHRLSEKCGKFPAGTIFTCDNCSKMFISQSLLDEHRSISKQCQRSPRTPTPVDFHLLNCVHCEKSFSSLFNLRFHLKTSEDCLAIARLRSEADEISSLDDVQSISSSSVMSDRKPHNLATGPHICKCCKVAFNSVLGLGLHLKRSQKCIADNPDIDIPGVVDKNSVKDVSSSGSPKASTDLGVKKPNQEVVFVCVKCCSSFSSVWGLRTHERNSNDCKPDRPYEIPVPIRKEEADKLKKEFLAKQAVKKEKEEPANDPSSPTSSSKQEPEKLVQKSGFMMVYTQESQDEDGKFKCRNCSALFTSVWGLRTHQRISETCMDKNAPRLPHYQKNKIILSDAAAKSIAKGENVCPNCSAKFSTSWGLRTHLRTSSICSENETNIKTDGSKKAKEGQILTCSKCEMVFLQLKQLRDHVKYSRSCLPDDVTIAKNGRVQPGVGCFLCPQCPKTFKLPFSLEQHFIEHAPQKDDWLCHLCTKDFADQFTMHRHFHREHLGRWFCIMCEKKSVLGSFKEFYSHIFDNHASDSDNAKKYFKCPTCFKSFLSKFSYDFHVSNCKKLSEQVFQCASCQKVFNKKIHITNHMKYAHTGVVIDKRYKFKCPKCPRKFLSKKDYLQKHEKESCLQEEIPCEICGEMYSGFEKLKMHLELAHKKRSELHTGGRKSPIPERKSSLPDSTTPERVQKTPEAVSKSNPRAAIGIASSATSPAHSSLSGGIQESPASPESEAPFYMSSVKIEPSSP